jgi:hypothetical protein
MDDIFIIAPPLLGEPGIKDGKLPQLEPLVHIKDINYPIHDAHMNGYKNDELFDEYNELTPDFIDNFINDIELHYNNDKKTLKWLCSCNCINLLDRYSCLKCGKSERIRIVDPETEPTWICKCKQKNYMISNICIKCSKPQHQKVELETAVYNDEADPKNEDIEKSAIKNEDKVDPKNEDKKVIKKVDPIKKIDLKNENKKANTGKVIKKVDPIKKIDVLKNKDKVGVEKVIKKIDPHEDKKVIKKVDLTKKIDVLKNEDKKVIKKVDLTKKIDVLKNEDKKVIKKVDPIKKIDVLKNEDKKVEKVITEKNDKKEELPTKIKNEEDWWLFIDDEINAAHQPEDAMSFMFSKLSQPDEKQFMKYLKQKIEQTNRTLGDVLKKIDNKKRVKAISNAILKGSAFYFSVEEDPNILFELINKI